MSFFDFAWSFQLFPLDRIPWQNFWENRQKKEASALPAYYFPTDFLSQMLNWRVHSSLSQAHFEFLFRNLVATDTRIRKLKLNDEFAFLAFQAKNTMTKKLYIETVGCQMNMLDSEMVVASLRKKGYELTDSTDDADTILFNTCSVREHAEHKTYSALGRLREHKKLNPHKVIGVMGCMAQKDQKLIFEKAPYVDIVVGPGQLQQIPDLIEKVKSGGQDFMTTPTECQRNFGPVLQKNMALI